MTNLIERPSHLPFRAPDRAERSERNATLTIYGLFLGAPFTVGITGLIGAVMAAGRRARSGPTSASHFRYQAWTFGASAGAMLTGSFWASVGSLATVANRTGGDLVLAGGALAATAGVGFVGATLFGLSRAAAGEPIGDPDRA